MPEITQKLGFDASSAIRSLGNLSKRLDAANQSLVNFKGTAGGSVAGLTNVNTALDKGTVSANKFSVSLGTITRVLQTQLIVRGLNLVLNALKEATGEARELGLAIAEIQTIAGGGLGTNQKITQDVIEISNAIGKPAKDIAEGVYQTLSNQVVEAGDALKFTAEAAKLATVTHASTADAINALSSVINSYNLKASDAGYITSVLSKTVEQGRLRLGEIANTIGRVLPIANQLGISFEEVNASIATMTTSGVRADTAITQLRAVTTQLLKPSEGLTEIFKRWGVEDGEQAIKTFGGLRGVMQKLATETGGSTQELADLLKNVRAIAGYFGTMVDEGNKVDEILKKLTEDAEFASKQWAEFVKTDAQQLTIQTEQLKNSWTTIGTTVMPLVIYSTKILSGLSQGLLVTGKALGGAYNAEYYAIKKINDERKKSKDIADELRKRQSDRQRKGYDEELQIANKYYAEIYKLETTAAAKRDDALAKSKAVLEAAGKGLASLYGDAIKELEKFVDKAADVQKDSAKEIDDVQREIDNRRFKSRLDSAKATYAKLSLYESQLSQQRYKVFQAKGNVDATKESKDRALSEIDSAIAIADQAKSLAEQTNRQSEIQKWESRILDLLNQKKKVISDYNANVQAAVPLAKREIAVRKQNQAALNKLVEEQIAIQTSGDLEAKDEGTRKRAQERLNEIEKGINQIFASAENGSALLKSLGLGKNLGVLRAELTNALNSATKDWNKEAKAAKDAFEKERIVLRVTTDPTGVRKEAAKILKVFQQPDETVATYNRRLDEKALETINEAASASTELDAKAQEMGGSLKTAFDLADQAGAGLQIRLKQIEDQIGTSIAAQKAAGKLATDEQISAEFAKQRSRAIESQVGSYNRLDAVAKRVLETLKSGQVVDQDTLKLFDVRLQKAKENQSTLMDIGQISKDSVSQYEQIRNLAADVNSKQASYNQLKKDAPTDEEVRAAFSIRDELQQRKATLADVQNLQGQVRADVSQTKNLYDQMVDPSSKVASNTSNTATATGNMASNIGEFARALSPTIGTLTTIAGLAERVATAMTTAATASQNIKQPATANQYLGGSMSYFALGGRGQDKIHAMLSRGETVISARNSQKFFSELNSMNQGRQPVYREQGGTVTNVGDINVTVNGGDSSQQTVREIGRALRREVQRNNIKLR